jgi:GNAT superfamily N-acetyltransferase
MNAMMPVPKVDVAIRDTTLADVPFIDGLQKLHREGLGFMATSWIEAKIAKNQIIIAEDAGVPVGYCMGVDRYLYRDDCGIIFQMNVVPGRQRQFIAAALLKAMFDRAAYGCRLFCCWCAQDLKANYFWEAMGFVPLAYRGGSEKKKGGRVHIFWQKRIREGDTQTPWWFPAKTEAGSLRADRIVLPIPAGKHWSDALPVLSIVEGPILEMHEKAAPALPAPRMKKAEPAKTGKPISLNAMGGLRPANVPSPVAPVAASAIEKPKREKKPKAKADPKLIAAARELRDRWLEHVNSGATMIEDAGKYDVTRALVELAERPTLLLPAA